MGNEKLTATESTKHEVLTILRNTTSPISGEQLAASCGVTRVSVWKAIQKLQEAGYGISGSRAGYQLTCDKADSLDPWEFGKAEKQFLHFHETESTMIEARKVAEENLNAGYQIITADNQTAGKGRAERTWTTTTGSLAFTLVTDTRIPVAESQRSLMASQLAVLRTLQAANPAKKFYLRWPNDIWTAEGKVCGILDEFRATGSYTQWINLGIGINLHQAPDGADCVYSDSMDEAGAVSHSRKELLESFLRQYESLISLISLQTDDLTEQWNAACMDTGRIIRLDDGNSYLFKGLNGYGWAQLDKDGNTELFPPGTARYIKKRVS